MRSEFKHLKLSDRHVIQNMLNMKKKYSEISKTLNVHKSTISREIARNSRKNQYSALEAQNLYKFKRKASVYYKEFDIRLFKHIIEKLENKFSPDAIAGELKTSYLNKKMQVSHQTIYNWIYTDRLGKDLRKYLLFGKKRYRKSAKNLENTSKKRVDQMPKCARNLKRLGDFEGDTIIGAKQKGSLLTFVDRKSKYLFASKLKNRTKETFSQTIKCMFADIDNDKLKTFVLDNEGGFNDFKSIEEMLQVKIYFAYPGRPWEKPVIENKNRMLRRFYPKNRKLDSVTDESVLQNVNWLNHYPRKSLNYRTPYQVFHKIRPVAFDT